MPLESKKLKAVIDTNIFISALNFSGKPEKVLDLLMDEKIDVYISPFILKELENVLSRKFKWDHERIVKALQLIKAKTTQVFPKSHISAIKDKDADNRIIECAIQGQVDYIISGDKRHLLPLKEYKDIKIVTPDNFLKLLDDTE
jgi:uncharacterized protein